MTMAITRRTGAGVGGVGDRVGGGGADPIITTGIIMEDITAVIMAVTTALLVAEAAEAFMEVAEDMEEGMAGAEAMAVGAAAAAGMGVSWILH